MLETLKREWKQAAFWTLVCFMVEMFALGKSFIGSLSSILFFIGYMTSAMIVDSIKRIKDEEKRKRYNTIYNVVFYSILGLVILKFIF